LFWLPVLGQWTTDTLNTNDYTYQSIVDTQPVYTPSFAQPSFKLLKKHPKGGEEYVRTAETAISLIDGTAGNTVVFINDIERLKFLSTVWNTWIATMSSASMTLTTVSKDRGVGMCASTCSTSHWAPTTLTSAARQKTSIDERFVNSRVHKVGSIYGERQMYAYTLSGPILQGAEEIMQTWINPTNAIVSPLANQNQTGFVRNQCLTGEMYAAVMSSTGDDGRDLDTNHQDYAVHMTRQVNGPADNWEEFFCSNE